MELEELINAFEWVSAGDTASAGCEAYVSILTGKIHWVGEGVEEDAPEDIDDGTLYIAVPHKNELQLGRSVAIDFVKVNLPEFYETVYGYFRNRGAYSRFKELLEREGQLEAWYRYEQNAVEEALCLWCEENDLVPVRPNSDA